MPGIFDYNRVAAANATIGGVNISEGWPPRNVNDAVRQLMADLASVAPVISVTPQMFGAKGDNATNDSVAMLAFFNYCITNNRPGHIPAGSYLINAGTLAFDNGHVDKAWPNITTDGFKVVRLRFADNVNKPMIALTNGTATSPAGQYWLGGCLGGFTVDDAVAVAGGGTNRHALSVMGAYATHFGWVRANDTAGDAVNCPQKYYGASNPDPYAVTYCTFAGAEANRTKGRAFTNMNGPGLNFCYIECVRAIETLNGGLYGFGASNEFRQLSVGSCFGWAVFDGNEGTIDRAYIADLELDNPQYGMRINRGTNVTIEKCRVIYRQNFFPNIAEGFWPRTAFELGAQPDGALRDVSIETIIRIDGPGNIAGISKFFDFNGRAAANRLNISCVMFDNIGLNITDDMLLSAPSANSNMLIVRDGKEIWNTILHPNAGASFTGTLSVPNTGFGSSAAILAFNNERFDPQGVYDPATYGWKAPRSGYVLVNICLPITLAVGTKVRLGIWLVRAGAGSLISRRDGYAITAGSQHYSLTQIIQVNAGDVLFAMGDQNTAAAVNAAPQSSADGEAVFQITPVP